MTLHPALLRVLPLIVPGMLMLSPATALAGGSYYRVIFAAPVARAQLVARDLLWSCTGDVCTASASNSRPAIVCATLAKSVGPLTAFSAGGVAFDAAALQKCNGDAS